MRPVKQGHHQVNQHDVWTVFPHDRERVLAVTGFCNDGDPIACQHSAHEPADVRVVIGRHDA